MPNGSMPISIPPQMAEVSRPSSVRLRLRECASSGPMAAGVCCGSDTPTCMRVARPRTTHLNEPPVAADGAEMRPAVPSSLTSVQSTNTPRPGGAVPATHVAAHLTSRRPVSANERPVGSGRSEEHTSELQSRQYLVCRLLLEKKKKLQQTITQHRSRLTIPKQPIPILPILHHVTRYRSERPLNPDPQLISLLTVPHSLAANEL